MKTIREVEDRWASPTVVALRYGNVAELAKLTLEAGALVNVATLAQRTARANLDLHKRSVADKTLTEAAALVRSATHARKGLAALDTAFNAALDQTHERMRALRAELDAAAAPSSNAGRAMQDMALLTMIQRMDPVKATAAIRGDAAMLRAVASAPRALSGLSEEAYSNLRREYWQQTAPDALERIDDLSAALAAAEQAHKSAHAEARDLIDFEAADLLAAAAKVEA